MKKSFNNIFLYFSYIFLLLTISVQNYIIIPLKKINYSSNEYSPEILIQNLFIPYYGYLNAGNPSQKTELQISSQYFGLMMEEDICLTKDYFDKSKSTTFKEISYYNLNQTIGVNETIEFPIINEIDKTTSNTTITTYYFNYYKSKISDKTEEENKKACIVFGFKFKCGLGIGICNSIPDYLKRNKLTNKENFLFSFEIEDIPQENNEYEASLIIGQNPHEYNKEKYHENNYFQTNVASYWKGELTWSFKLKNYYYFNGEKINFYYKKENQVYAEFLFDLELIKGTKDYFESIKSNYFNNYNKECKFDSINNYTIISCDKKFNTEKFPTLYFQQLDYNNFTFELTHKDLFEIRGDKKYFLIVFDSNSDYYWNFGKIFLKKYLLNFDYESKTIGFYTDLKYDSDSNNNGENNDKKKNSSFGLFIIWIILLIITGIGCFFLGKLIYDKNRKKRANELEDDYDYVQKNNEENINSDENKLGLN